MSEDFFLLSAGVSGLIGSVAPFLLPSLFRLLSKLYKREITKEEKRLVITIFSAVIAVILLMVKFEWVGDLREDLNNFGQFFFINFVAIKGMVQTIYELIIKNVPLLNERFS